MLSERLFQHDVWFNQRRRVYRNTCIIFLLFGRSPALLKIRLHIKFQPIGKPVEFVLFPSRVNRPDSSFISTFSRLLWPQRTVLALVTREHINIFFTPDQYTISIVKQTRCTRVSNLCYFGNDTLRTCFGRSFRPSSGVQDCTYSNRHLSNCFMYDLEFLMMDGKIVRNM